MKVIGVTDHNGAVYTQCGECGGEFTLDSDVSLVGRNGAALPFHDGCVDFNQPHSFAVTVFPRNMEIDLETLNG